MVQLALLQRHLCRKRSSRFIINKSDKKIDDFMKVPLTVGLTATCFHSAFTMDGLGFPS